MIQCLKSTSLLLVLLLFTAAIPAYAQATDKSDKSRPRKIIASVPKPILIGRNYKPQRRSVTLVKSVLDNDADAEFVAKEVFSLINLKRKERGLSELIWDSELSSVARDHSEKMAVHGFFSHYGVNGRTVDARADAMGVDSWRSIGENIAYCKGIENPSAFAVERWMLSKGHKKNLLSKMWERSAVGVAITVDGKYFFTQVFVTD